MGTNMDKMTLRIVAAVGIFCLGILALTPAQSLPKQGASSVTQATQSIDPLVLAKKKLTPQARQKLLARQKNLRAQ
jgi:hypothetical protein